MPEQRNFYKGSPSRPWLRLVLVAPDGATRELDVLADTGNPCPLIVGSGLMHEFCLCGARGVETNFGPLDGGWLRIAIPQLTIHDEVLGYASDAVLQAVEASYCDFEGLAGLPLLRMAEYGGDRDAFWIRTP